MSDVFISHDTADKDLVLQLAQQLEAAGISTWYYERDAVPGVPHTSQTGNAIAGAKATLLVLSSNSIRSYEVNTEVNWTYSEHKSFVPVLVGITWAQFAHEKKDWQQLIGLSAGIEATPDNLPMVGSKIARGLRQLEVAAAARRAPASPPADLSSLKTRADEAASAPRHNLPLQVTRFFGREADITQLKARLAEHRLVTLAGSGGVGKTRLSQRVAEDLVGEYADGVWFASLAPLTDPALVPQTVAATLDLRDDKVQAPLEAVINFLRPRQVLLVLDNCEHLLEACAQLADSLLHTCPRLTILASSREPLGVDGESVLAVPSLSFPAAGTTPQAAQLSEYAAVRLFTDRVHLTQPDYAVTASNAAAITRICQRLDGIPLALELAAARLRLLDTETLAARLDDAFSLLTGGSRTALPRQQTLRATMDWSYRLLRNDERLLLQRLSVFAGGCTLEAAEAVCSGAGLEAGQVLDQLAALVDKSMVRAERQPGQDTRYFLLETVRQYAREKIQESGDTARLRTRHRDYFLAFFEANVARLQTSERPALRVWLKPDQDNRRQALEWSLSDESNIEAAPRLFLANFAPWTFRELRDWSQRVVAWCETHPTISDRLYARVLESAAADDHQTAELWSRRSVEVSRRLGPEGRETLMWSLNARAGFLQQDFPDEAVEPFTEAEAILASLSFDHYAPDEWMRVKGYFAMIKSDLLNMAGRHQEAKAAALESIRLYEASGSPWFAQNGLRNLAFACVFLGEYDQARRHLRARQQWGLSGTEDEEENSAAYDKHLLATAALFEGDLDQALDLVKQAIPPSIDTNDYNLFARLLVICAAIWATYGQPTRAARLAGASHATFIRVGRKPWNKLTLEMILPGWHDGPQSAEIQQALDEGQAMNTDEAVAYALGENQAN